MLIISRRDKEQKYKLSPLTNHIDTGTGKGKVIGGFNRVQFKLDCELIFDKALSYKHEFMDKTEVLIKKAKGEIMIEVKKEIVLQKTIKKVPQKQLEPKIEL